MMNYIWAGMLGISFVCAAVRGDMESLSAGAVDGANQAVELILSIAGVMCFWSGMMEIAKRSGITSAMARFFSPLLSKLFSDVDKDSDAMHYISLNISANMLGLGNAATPFGLKAIKELKRINPSSDTASDSMLLFVVMNTASLQLIPTTLGTYRTAYGSENPFDILPAVWITSVCALFVGIAVAKCTFFGRRRNSQKE